MIKETNERRSWRRQKGSGRRVVVSKNKEPTSLKRKEREKEKGRRSDSDGVCFEVGGLGGKRTL